MHDHEQEHAHGHDGHPHEHEHDHHGQGHDHGHHHHEHPAPENTAQLIALLDYMCRHNESHADELDKVLAKLSENADGAAAADRVRAAKDAYTQGNALLREALGLVRELDDDGADGQEGG